MAGTEVAMSRLKNKWMNYKTHTLISRMQNYINTLKFKD
jgi:hypothetical protein